MKKIFIILAFLITGFGADAATQQPRGRAQSNVSQSNPSTSGAQTARAARSRSAARTPVAPVPASSTPSTPGVSTRKTQTIVSTESDKRATGLVSRAAKQSVISTGTKVAAAAQNTVVDEKCWNGFMGCMDSFCMLDNANGGRCICSDKNAEYDSILAEIQSLDEQSYQMATVGVERIEMGDDANAVMKKTQEITKSIEKDSAQSKRKTLDLSAWDVNEIDFDAEVEDIFSLSSDGTGIANKTGDALYRAAAKLCNAQIPECKSQSTMMELMYKQRVRSDCTAYENSLRQQRTQSAQKLATAQSAMREAALEQYRNANKYDLGQCTVQFKQCMQTTGGCGDDFSGCVGSIQEVTTGVNFESLKQKKIKGTSSSITIAQSTYDILEAKKALCMTVTQQCVNVRDQVWDTFLREVAPQVKSAELTAESDMRSSCISNISTCFQKACKDNMDPNDPDGSYDMCLTRPDMVKDVCKIQVTPCENSIPHIMDYVTARLASMRVDSCTREFKECLTSEDRCGADYTKCVGLDTDTIVEMCPVDKLPGCKYDPSGADDKNYVYQGKQEDVRANLAQIATGIFLNIDNNLLSACQKAVQSKVLEICGSLSECDAFDEDDVIGTDSLISYKNTAGDTVIEGLMNIGVLTFDDSDPKKPRFHRSSVPHYTNDRIKAAINTIENRAAQKFNVLSTDLTIQRCVEGRDDKWRYNANGDETNEFQRFPNLLNSYTQMIFNSALNKAQFNYRTKYDELLAKALEDQSDDVKSMLCAAISYNEGSAYCTEYSATEDGDPVCTAYAAYGALDDIFNNLTAQNDTGSGGSMSSKLSHGGSSDIGTSGLSSDGLRYIVRGADITKKLQNMSKGKGEFIQTDADGNMIGKISMTSVYNSGTNTCNVTTESMLCKNLETIITNVEVRNVRRNAHIQTDGVDIYGGGDESKGKVKKVKMEVYHGQYCAEFQEPIITSDEIKM